MHHILPLLQTNVENKHGKNILGSKLNEFYHDKLPSKYWTVAN